MLLLFFVVDSQNLLPRNCTDPSTGDALCSPESGIVLNSLGQANDNMWWLITMFSMMCLWFSSCTQFNFGADVADFSSTAMSILSTLRILMGENYYAELEAADAAMVLLFDYGFCVWFSFILVNMFLSIIIGAYDKETKRLNEPATTRTP